MEGLNLDDVVACRNYDKALFDVNHYRSKIFPSILKRMSLIGHFGWICMHGINH